MRETGPIRKDLHGDTEVAETHISHARTVLGSLKDGMKATGQQQGTIHQTMPDGTLIKVQSVFGQDSVHITSPAKQHKPAADQHRKHNPRSTPYLWVGARITGGGIDTRGNQVTKLHLCVWEPGKDPEIISNRSHLMEANQQPSDTPAVYPLQDPAKFFPDGDRAGMGYTTNGTVQLSTNNPKGLPMTAPDNATVIWDEIVIADPWDEAGTGVFTPDPVGTYIVKVMAWGPDCKTVAPTRVELKIIIGKEDQQLSSYTQFEIAECTQYRMGLLPKGWFSTVSYRDGDPCDDCSIPIADDGANPHGMHWWQGAGVAVVLPRDSDMAGAINFTNDVYLPPTGFVPGEFLSRIDRCPGCDITYTSYFKDPKFDAFSLHVDVQLNFEDLGGGGGYTTTRQTVTIAPFTPSVTDTDHTSNPNFKFRSGTQIAKSACVFLSEDIAPPVTSYPWKAQGTYIYDTGWIPYWKIDPGTLFFTGYTAYNVEQSTGHAYIYQVAGLNPTDNHNYSGGAASIIKTVQRDGPGHPAETLAVTETIVTPSPQVTPPTTQTCTTVLLLDD